MRPEATKSWDKIRTTSLRGCERSAACKPRGLLLRDCGDVRIEGRFGGLELLERQRLLSLRRVGARKQIAHATVVRRRGHTLEKRRLRERIEPIMLVVDPEVDV